MTIFWAGNGDLRGVLAAQPLPEALSQRFLGDLYKVGPAVMLVPADLFCVLQDVEASPYLADALHAADVDFIVAERCQSIISQLGSRRGVWLFDERRPATLMTGLERALEGIFARRLQCDAVISEDRTVFA